MNDVVCTHLDEIAMRELPASVVGCEDCLRTGDEWLHLRICSAAQDVASVAWAPAARTAAERVAMS